MNFLRLLLLLLYVRRVRIALLVLCLQGQEELFVVVKETHTRERERSIASPALVCLRMGLALRVAAPARSAKMRRHQVGCVEDLTCKSLEAIVTCLVLIVWRVLHSYLVNHYILHIHIPLLILPPSRHVPLLIYRGEPHNREQGPRKAAASDTRTEHE